jgi:hypothetical protein
MTESEVTAASDRQSLVIRAISVAYPGKELAKRPELNRAVWQIPGPPVIPAIMQDAVNQRAVREGGKRARVDIPVHAAA